LAEQNQQTSSCLVVSMNVRRHQEQGKVPSKNQYVLNMFLFTVL
jgi:hypothetical protein